MDPYAGFDEVRASGRWVKGPPWILGHRGVPREAPENTLSSLRRAVDVGLDGFEYDLRACSSGEPVLMHDERLERTTDARGELRQLSLPELFGIDCGSWFSRRFAGEPLALLDEALEIGTPPMERGGGEQLLHMIELKERGLVRGVARRLAERHPPPSVRVASFLRDVVLEARDAGLPTMLLGIVATEEDRRFVRDERLAAYSVGPRGWSGEAGQADWSFCECWSWSLDDPEELVELCRRPLFGFNTNEPYRALATRALVRLAPQDTGSYPVQAPALEVAPESLEDEQRTRGEWYGAWDVTCELRNPFPFPVEVRCGTFVRSGAFEIEGLPRVFDLEPGEQQEVPFVLKGGARLPGADPLFAALYKWRGSVHGSTAGDMSAGGQLLFDAPLIRERRVHLDGLARRLPLLRENPGDPDASLTARIERGTLLLSIENPGELTDPHLIARLGRRVVRGGSGLRMSLPPDFERSSLGLGFSAGIEGLRDGERVLRRWSGGLPAGLGHGAPGRLYFFHAEG